MSTCMGNGEESQHRNITNDSATADLTADAIADEDVELNVQQCPSTSSSHPLPMLMISILYGISEILIM